ncbi:transglutaminase family protein [Aestuariirhabdus sp. Z084]|uniref:transglutaminase-like domain-containing protein n=1 Tax=Aestuariirhabdus haliotis TaxID=2918751 RepID=UPI00201B3589|nr:transglutaminase family protein [Aestuariirhabdus haliotis]MCL6415574.1 transglutaminase family protein [Aestuariirhabdus haliotis]MCL6419221.1 transglutaminase family protein [Aestuariirhabdus haliotis]
MMASTTTPTQGADPDHSLYLAPTAVIDSTHPEIVRHSQQLIAGHTGQRQQAIALYYSVRDAIRYDPYRIGTTLESSRASAILASGHGYCVSKAVLLAALARAADIPARLGFADVRNHLTSERLRQAMGTDLFAWHGYTELFIEGQWVKATPAFNLSLCEKTGVKPLEFDGLSDSVFHEFDQSGQRHMEYVTEHGHFADLPFERMFQEYQRHYPGMMAALAQLGEADFESEAQAG